MKKSNAIGFTLIVASLAVAAPIWYALSEAQNQGLDIETTHAFSFAKDILRRSDTAADQVWAGLDKLTQAQLVDPCSAQAMTLMQQMDLSSTYIQAFGHVHGNRLLCSSMGLHGDGIPIPPVDVVTSRGLEIRYGVNLPLARGHQFVVAGKDGFVAIIHKNPPIDTAVDESGVALAVYNLELHRPLTQKGAIDPRWMNRLEDRTEVTFNDGDFVVAIVKSPRYLQAAIAAVPMAHVQARSSELAKGLVPIGLFASAVLAVAILYLARLQLAMPTAIKAAIKRNEFFLAYQPIVDLHTGQWMGVEALIRWRRPVGEVLSPDFFIPIAENNGLMERITANVVALAVKDMGDVFAKYPHFHLAINLSPDDLHSKRTAKLLASFLQQTGANPRNLIVEATERGFMQVNIAKAITSEIRANGIGVALDDFGTGYSSLSYLHSFELDFLKIDKSFVETIATEAPTSQVVSHIIGMAKSLGLQMVAEGVETPEQAEFLRDQGVQFAQGWLFGKPMSFEEILEGLAMMEAATAEREFATS